MALDKQIHIFSVDTSAFYHPEEKRIAKRLSRLRKIRTDFREKYPNDFYKELGKIVTDKTDFNRIKRASYTAIKDSQIILLNDYSAIWHDIVQIKKRIKLHKKLNKKITETKEKLINAFAQAVEYNKTHEEKRIRELNPAMLKNWNIISVFESSLTRVIGAKTDEVSDDIMIIRIYFFDILQDLILNGYNCNGEHYVYFSSSAGQIRTKKAVFIKESTFKQYEGTLMCGLTVDKINELGGMNINKYLAYLALDNSASDLYEEFDIDRTIVVEDFETNVTGEVDFIDDKTYDIERKVMEVPVPHTDGCGMIRTSDKNFTIRLPWIKGLLASWDFIDFINEHNGSYIVKDIYGDEHNLLEENIEIIFTKSQFKTWKFYKNWDEYKKLYKENNCQAGICCMEEDKIPYSTINYQMLQTLTDITEPEINGMVKKSNDRIHNLTNTIDEMLRVLGVDERTNETNSSPYSLALRLYPEMLADSYSKEIIKACKKSMLKRYKAGKLEINGKYTFLLPDLYAVSQKLFLGMDNPEGILQDGEVYCSLFRQGEVDVLRSPHLYKEHAIRNNVKGDIQKRWFKTNAIYTSCHDLISKILQFDVDGDRALVISDKNFCNIAKRNMNGIVPLYYNMQKAKAVEITPQAIYDGLVTAFVGGNIGCYSNDISKIWNSGEITDEAIRCVKWLCMENNFTID